MRAQEREGDNDQRRDDYTSGGDDKKVGNSDWHDKEDRNCSGFIHYEKDQHFDSVIVV